MPSLPVFLICSLAACAAGNNQSRNVVDSGGTFGGALAGTSGPGIVAPGASQAGLTGSAGLGGAGGASAGGTSGTTGGGFPGASGTNSAGQMNGTAGTAGSSRAGSGGGGGGTGQVVGGAGGVSGGGVSGGGVSGGGVSGGGVSGGGVSGGVDCSGAPLAGGMAHCNSNGSGTAGSYAWSLWSTGGGGCITPYGVGAAFKATWNNSGDFLAREGFQWDETKTYDQYGTISADYAYTKTGTGGGYSYIGIYGWSNNPLIEFYIVDDWFGAGGPPTANGTLKGSFSVDGATYNVYTHTQTNQPSIHGTATFDQFFSVRQTRRQCGHISITEHFKTWASLSMNLGKMYEAKLLIEAGGGSGSIDFTSASMSAQ